MYINYLKISLRRLLKHRIFTLINIGGLAFGFACCIIMTMFVLDELSYDRFHQHKDRIIRLTTHAQMGENTWNSVVVSPALGPAIEEDIPEVELAVRLVQFDQVTVSNGDRIFIENDVLAADDGFFQMFTFEMIEGNHLTALESPNSLVITKEYANKYFNADQGILGRTLYMDGIPYAITGVLENIPQNSHFQFDLVYAYASLLRAQNLMWQNSNSPTYLLLNEDADIETIQQQVMALMERRSNHYQQIKEAGFSWDIGIQALTEIHLHSSLEDELAANGDYRTVQFMIIIAAFILLIAMINFINMSTARSADRAKEVGVRKTMGILRSQLISQFLAESTAIALLAMIVAILGSYLLKFPFEAITGKKFLVSILANPSLIIICLAVAVITGIIAGIYPAFYISRFKPVDVLSGTPSSGSSSGLLRNGLVVFQFVIAAGLIFGTFIVSDQLRYIRNKDLGFDREHVITIKNADKLEDNFDAFRQSLLSESGIVSVGYSDYGPLDDKQGSMFLAEGSHESEARIMTYTMIDPGYIPTMGIQLIDGRNFSENMAMDTSAMILNEAAAKSLGLANPIGKMVTWGSLYQVIGLVQDFHFMSMEEEIKPVVFMLAGSGNAVEVRLHPENIQQTLTGIEEIWNLHSGRQSPMQYSFVDEDFARLYEKHERLNKVFGSFSFLAILISCLGLFALSAFMTEKRAKEIGIRKVLGASIESIAVLVSKEFTLLVSIALIVAIPVSYYLMDQWLDNFSYRITLGIYPVLITAVLVLMIAWVTVSFHSIGAALRNPVDILKDE